MKPAPFEYHAPTTLDEAIGVLHQFGDDAKVIAGGQSLVPMLNLRLARFDALVDLGGVAELRGIERMNGTVTVGAMVRQHEVESDATVAADVPLLAAATPLIGHFQIRNRGTVGGSVAHADPAAEYPAVCAALDAELELAGPGGRRRVDAAEFFTGTWTTTIEPEEVLVALRFPVWGAGSAFAVEEVARRHGDFAIAGAACGVQVDRGRVARAAIALFGLGSTPVRATDAEAALVGAAAADVEIVEVAQAAVRTLDPPDDLHASSQLRRRIGAAVVTRALRRAIEEAVGA